MSLDLHIRFTQTARALQGGMPWRVPGVAPAVKSLRDLTQINPRPLINPDARMVVLFSPKAACTHVTIWFFHHLGHGVQAREYSRWPHKYRNGVYYQSPLYKKACKLDLSRFKVIRVIRDPYDRVASSFRHAVLTHAAGSIIAAHFGDPEIETRGLSFEQFLTYLEGIDLTACDPHFRVQRHPIEDVLPVDHLINISTDDLPGRLAEIESEIGLPPPGPTMDRWLSALSNHKRPNRECVETPGLHTRRFTQRQAARGPWPSHDALLTPAARARIAKLYAVDIAAYLKPATPSHQS